MIPHLKHYAHAPNYEATHAIAPADSRCGDFVSGHTERRQKKRIIRRSCASQRQNLGLHKRRIP